MQNEIHKHISVSQDGGNLVPRVCVTLNQQLGNKDSGNEIGLHCGSSHKCLIVFVLAFAFVFVLL